MKYTSRLLAVLLVVGSLGTPLLYADGGGDYSAPPAVEDGAVILANRGDDLGGQPVDEGGSAILMAHGGIMAVSRSTSRVVYSDPSGDGSKHPYYSC